MPPENIKRKDILNTIQVGIRELLNQAVILQSITKSSDPLYIQEITKIAILEKLKYLRALFHSEVDDAFDEIDEIYDKTLIVRRLDMNLQRRTISKDGEELGEIKGITLSNDESGETILNINVSYLEEDIKKESFVMKNRKISGNYLEILSDYEFSA